MNRPDFTLTTKARPGGPPSISYSCSQLTVTLLDGTGKPAISVICSGRSQTFLVEDIEKIEFHPEGATWCGWCDQSLANLHPAT